MTVVAKVCTRCGEGKLLEHFPVKPGGKHGRDSWCDDCKNDVRRERGYSSKRSDASLRASKAVAVQVRREAKARGMTVSALTSLLLAYGLEAVKRGVIDPR